MCVGKINPKVHLLELLKTKKRYTHDLKGLKTNIVSSLITLKSEGHTDCGRGLE